MIKNQHPMKYGLQCGFGGQINVGRINKKQTQFLDKEDLTQQFIRAVIDKFGGYETVVTGPKNERITITVKIEKPKKTTKGTQ